MTAAVFVSPHFDDAVLSCGGKIPEIPGSTVITVFSGGPARVDPLPVWDQKCGFAPGDDVMAVRALEDDAALDRLQAQPQRLGFWDGQYRGDSGNRLVRAVRWRLGNRRLVRDVAEKLVGVIEELGLETVFIPLGVGHPDHKLTTKASLGAARRLPHVRWVVYEDLPYAAESSANSAAALRAIATAGFTLEPLEPGEPRELEAEVDATDKRAALDCYRSQLDALGQRLEVALNAPERYHRLVV